MDILTPEYGKQLLQKIFEGKKDVIIRDYNSLKVCDGKYSERGVVVLAYSDSKDISAYIGYLPNGKIYFKFETNNGQETLLDVIWDKKDVYQEVYDYFIALIVEFVNSRNKFRRNCSNFTKSENWLRDKKLSNIID